MIAKHIPRVLIYAVLLVAALFFLAPLYVMLATSFKDAEQIRAGNLLSLNFDATYQVSARFDNIGGLKPNAAVKSAGVVTMRSEKFLLSMLAMSKTPKPFFPRAA